MPRKNSKPEDFPQAVVKQIERLAQNIVIARKRRNESQAQWAQKLGVSQPTMARIERGDPSVAMVSYVMCIWLIDPAASLSDLVSPLNDRGALEREISKIRPRNSVVKSAVQQKLRDGFVKQTSDSLKSKPQGVPVDRLGKNTSMKVADALRSNPNPGIADLLRKSTLTTISDYFNSSSATVRSAMNKDRTELPKADRSEQKQAGLRPTAGRKSK